MDIPRVETLREAASEAPLLRLHLFGHMGAINAAGKSVLPRARKTRAVLAVLALSAPRPVLRTQLTALLWSQREKDQARASLRQAVHELQESLGSPAGRLLCPERNHLALLVGGLWVDALNLGRDTGNAEAMLDLFRAPLLEDLNGLDPSFDRWLDNERRRLCQVGRTIAEGLLRDCTDSDGILRAAERLLVIDRSHEGAWQAAIRIHIERGDRGAALATFERCRSALAETSFMAPNHETLALVAGLRGHTAATAGGASVRKTLPPAQAPPLGSSQGTSQGPSQSPPIAVRAAGNGIRLGICPLRPLDAERDDRLAAGLTDEITTGLSRFRGISCVPIKPVFAAGGESVPTTEGLESLALDFLVEGTIQRGGTRVRVMARLIDVSAGGEVIWAHRFDRDGTDVLTMQDEIASAIVAQVDPHILLRQGERTAAMQLENPTPHELVLQSIPAVYRLERSGFNTAGILLDVAVSEDPNNAAAHAWYAYWHLFLVGQGWAPDPEGATKRAVELAQRAVMLDSGDARSLTLAGHVRGFLGKHAEEAYTLHARALALNPNLALAWCFSGLAQCYCGNHEQALRHIRQAMRLSPYDPHLFFFDMALTMPHFLLGQYEEAATIGRRAIELNPGFTSSYKGYLAALGHLGRGREASQIRQTLLEMEPGFTVRQAIERSPMTRDEDLERYAAGLRLAGLPE